MTLRLQDAFPTLTSPERERGGLSFADAERVLAEAQARGVSRQRLYQLRQRLAGRCEKCGSLTAASLRLHVSSLNNKHGGELRYCLKHLEAGKRAVDKKMGRKFLESLALKSPEEGEKEKRKFEAKIRRKWAKIRAARKSNLYHDIHQFITGRKPPRRRAARRQSPQLDQRGPTCE